jgi:hypothetical protein
MVRKTDGRDLANNSLVTRAIPPTSFQLDLFCGQPEHGDRNIRRSEAGLYTDTTASCQSSQAADGKRTLV